MVKKLKQLWEKMPFLYPTPVVLVTCADPEGKPNVLTATCVGIACAKPPFATVSVHPFVYSHSLIMSTNELVINVPTDDLLEDVEYCGTVSGRKEDKFAMSKLTPLPASKVKPPLIKECPINIECIVRHRLSLGIHDLLISEVVATHVDDDLIRPDGKLDLHNLRFLACIKGTGEWRNLRVVYTAESGD